MPYEQKTKKAGARICTTIFVTFHVPVLFFSLSCFLLFFSVLAPLLFLSVQIKKYQAVMHENVELAGSENFGWVPKSSLPVGPVAFVRYSTMLRSQTCRYRAQRWNVSGSASCNLHSSQNYPCILKVKSIRTSTIKCSMPFAALQN